MLSDFEHVLSLLFADEAKRNRDYTRAALEAVPMERSPRCKLDILAEIWSAVMPQRTLAILDDKIEATVNNGGTYAARDMSDGERVALYLMGQALCAPQAAVVIIDEPEIHLHRAVQALLWDEIEASRPDCAFVYITHDLDFAATRTAAPKIWLRGYDGNFWKWQEVVSSPALPDALLFQVLGNRRPLLFVEGDETSYDSAVYRALFPRELVLPRQSCEKVVEATKSMNGLSGLHNLRVRGLVDRDRRGDEEVTALRSAGVLVADVAEVENLLCLPEVLEAVARQLSCPDVPVARAKAEERVLGELAKAIDQQALSRALAEIQFRLNGFGPRVGKSDATKLESDLRDYINEIDVGTIVARCRKLLEDVVSAKDYRSALRFYNCKGIVNFVASSFPIAMGLYSQIVMGILKAEPDGLVAKAMREAIDGKLEYPIMPAESDPAPA